MSDHSNDITIHGYPAPSQSLERRAEEQIERLRDHYQNTSQDWAGQMANLIEQLLSENRQVRKDWRVERLNADQSRNQLLGVIDEVRQDLDRISAEREAIARAAQNLLHQYDNDLNFDPLLVEAAHELRRILAENDR